MKETKVYVDELPTQCLDCRFAYDGRCQAKENGESYCVENCRRSDCPLIDIKTHDRELVKEVCEKISIELENETETYCEIRQCNSPHYQGDYIWFNYVKFRKLAEKLQKEYEDE